MNLNIQSRTFSLLILLLFSVLGNAQNRPNIIVILTDDQGYGDLSCHGNPVIKTPNMDKLYSESVRFTNFHVDPTCAPTRSALLTGKYSHNVGVWHTVCGGNHLRASEVTMADVFKNSGYKTSLFGKWHLGANYPYRPMDRGFDEWLGHGDGGTGTTDDYFYNDRVNDYYIHNGKREYREGYAPDVFFDSAIDFITNSEDEKPFFVYLATYLPHHPHTVPNASMIDKYKGKISDWVAYFFAGIDRVDQNIGKLRKALEASGKANNTILIFMSDNGGTAGVKLYNAGMRGQKTQVYEGGHRVLFFVHWPNGNIAQNSEVKDVTAHIDLLPTLIDVCNLNKPKDVSFDGRSFKKQLFKPEKTLSKRILFVENQRTFKAQSWWQTVGMMDNWRLIDNKELYDLSTDFSQKNNVIEKYPKVVKKIQKAHSKYWKLVTPNDREKPRPIIGNSVSNELFLSSSDWYLPKVPWNHAQIAKGSPLSGSWEIEVASEGMYNFEIRRWPREANTTFLGIPSFKNKKVDAFDSTGKIEKLIYGNEMKSLPVAFAKLEVGEFSAIKNITETDTQITFDIKLKKGFNTVKGTLLDKQKNVIAGAYYVYLTKI
ncbi:Arylsulfatase A [Lutibacter oricola]|uniref:Arylsulfatase A n=1 Tax=Lutibacter oricola TaxID=762486 RepID=A0A1H3DUJ3_9FLAO|nr:arylsulfatase [Lutibacter oricola]SDX69344.1 Arylsulfatase A [Lutibacter oricola]